MGCSWVNMGQEKMTWKGCCRRDDRPSFKKTGFGDLTLSDTGDNDLAREQGQFGHDDLEQPRDLSHLESSELKLHKRA